MSRSDVSGDPLYKVLRVLGLDSLNLILDLFHRDFASEDTHDRKVSTVSWVRRSHHVSSVKHLLSELGYRYGSIAGRTICCERSETDHEEMETREGHHVDGQLSQIRVELTGESETGGDTGHDERHEIVQVGVSGTSHFERSEADVVQSFVVDTEGLVRVFDELMDGKGGIVWLDDGVRYLNAMGFSPDIPIHINVARLWRWDDGECTHHPIRVFFSNL